MEKFAQDMQSFSKDNGLKAAQLKVQQTEALKSLGNIRGVAGIYSVVFAVVELMLLVLLAGFLYYLASKKKREMYIYYSLGEDKKDVALRTSMFFGTAGAAGALIGCIPGYFLSRMLNSAVASNSLKIQSELLRYSYYGRTMIKTLDQIEISELDAGTVVKYVLFTVLFAYPLSRKNLPGRKFVSFYVFFTMLFNGGLVPTYIMWTQTFHIKNTIWALIIPSLLMNAFYIIMMRSFFTANIPDELIEAARIDGAGEYTILFRIVMPLSKPMLATLTLMIGLGYWNDWMNSLYYVTDEKLFSIQAILNTIITNIQFLQSSQSAATQSGLAASMPSVGIRMAIAVIGIVPVLCIYPFFQKYFVRGIVVGGVKG